MISSLHHCFEYILNTIAQHIQRWVKLINPSLFADAVFTREELSEGGTRMGDLQAGSEVVLHSISPDGAKCLVEGMAVQGWPVKGWVACNRLESGGD